MLDALKGSQMSYFRSIFVLGVTTLALGCAGAQTEDPVVTRSADGKSPSPSGVAAAKRGASFVRFVNALPGSAPLGVTSDGKDLFGAVDFRSVTAYQEMRDNMTTFSLRAANGSDEMATNNESMTDGFRYTIVALPNEQGGASIRVFRDELVTDTAKARVRVIHAAPGLEDVDLAVRGQREALFDNIAYSREAGFRDVDPMSASFEIRTDNGGPNLLRLPRLTLKAGRSYTIILTGSTPAKLSTIVFDDTITPVTTVASQRGSQ